MEIEAYLRREYMSEFPDEKQRVERGFPTPQNALTFLKTGVRGRKNGN